MKYKFDNYLAHKTANCCKNTINQIDIPALLDTWVKSTLSEKISYPPKKCFYLYFRKNITRLNFGLLTMSGPPPPATPVSSKIVYRWVMIKLLFPEPIIKLSVSATWIGMAKDDVGAFV